MDLSPQELMKFQVLSLRHQMQIKRINTSEAIKDIMDYCKENEATDHVVNPAYPKDKTANPWVEEKKCAIL